MRMLRVVLATATLVAGSILPAPAPQGHDHGSVVHAAKCTPSAQGTCTACKKCTACKHCSSGGTCSVCKPSRRR
jgi:hypothetical protein